MIPDSQIAADEKLCAELSADTWGKLGRDLALKYMAETKLLRARIAELEAGMPKTADGVPVSIGMEVHYKFRGTPRKFKVAHWEMSATRKGDFYLRDDLAYRYCGKYASEVYSTPEADESAKESNNAPL